MTQLDPTSTATKLWPEPREFDRPLAPVLALDHIDAISGRLPSLPGNAMR
ncbi:hypothetical protein [Streptomyces decoyicus]|nr:hypothetical protein [Streptomyces decoyicus]QZY19323.1 hypothetical protein K7C20_32280 [Streptomyces decoyicus]